MSGGHFDYAQHRVWDIADEIERSIARAVESDYPPDIIERFKEAAHTLRQASEMAQRIDWLVSGDDGAEAFRKRWKEEVRWYWNEKKGQVK